VVPAYYQTLYELSSVGVIISARMTRTKKSDSVETQANLNAVVAAGVVGGLGLVLLVLLLVAVAILR